MCVVLCTRRCTHIINFSPTPSAPAVRPQATPPKNIQLFSAKESARNRKVFLRSEVVAFPPPAPPIVAPYAHMNIYTQTFSLSEGKKCSWIEKCCGKMRLRFFLAPPIIFLVFAFFSVWRENIFSKTRERELYFWKRSSGCALETCWWMKSDGVCEVLNFEWASPWEVANGRRWASWWKMRKLKKWNFLGTEFWRSSSHWGFYGIPRPLQMEIELPILTFD